MLSIAAITLLCFIFGAIVGSFLGVCIYRIPMGRYEPVHPGIRELAREVTVWRPARSFCPRCERQLLWWHNIPVVSFFLLRGRCSFCTTRIPLRYPLLEWLTGALCVASYLCFGLTATGYAVFAVLCALVVVAFIDIDYMIIPDKITYPGTALGLIIAAANQRTFSQTSRPLLPYPFVPDLAQAGMGLLLGPGVLLAVWALYWLVRRREGLGLGDIKLLALVGAMFGAEAAWFTILLGSILGSLFGLAAILSRRQSLSAYIPFGPYLVAAAITYLLKLDVLLPHLLFSLDTASPWKMLREPW